MNFLINGIDGTIRPQTHRKCHEKSATAIQLNSWQKRSSLSIWNEMDKNFDTYFLKEESSYWKERTIVCMLVTSSILSLSFYPSDPTITNQLFIQKLHVKEKREGFIAPYLSELNREKLNAIECPSTTYQITDEMSIYSSIEKYEKKLQQELQKILHCFFKDTKTTFIGITYHNEGKYFTEGWIKV